MNKPEILKEGQVEGLPLLGTCQEVLEMRTARCVVPVEGQRVNHQAGEPQSIHTRAATGLRQGCPAGTGGRDALSKWAD